MMDLSRIKITDFSHTVKASREISFKQVVFFVYV